MEWEETVRVTVKQRSKSVIQGEGRFNSRGEEFAWWTKRKRVMRMGMFSSLQESSFLVMSLLIPDSCLNLDTSFKKNVSPSPSFFFLKHNSRPMKCMFSMSDRDGRGWETKDLFFSSSSSSSFLHWIHFRLHSLLSSSPVVASSAWNSRRYTWRGGWRDRVWRCTMITWGKRGNREKTTLRQRRQDLYSLNGREIPGKEDEGRIRMKEEKNISWEGVHFTDTDRT